MTFFRWVTALAALAGLVISGGTAIAHTDEAGSAPAAKVIGGIPPGGQEPAVLARAVAEVATAVTDAGRPPCGAVQVSVERTPDGRSWAWPQSCRILFDTGLVDRGGAYFRWVARHEVAHLHAGTDHYDHGFRALDARLARNIGLDLLYAPGAEYPALLERAHDANALVAGAAFDAASVSSRDSQIVR